MSKPSTVWTAVTRRAFVAMIGGAAAALVIGRGDLPEPKPDPEPAPNRRWIGHI